MDCCLLAGGSRRGPLRWLAVCFGTGILLYFAAPAEPSLFAPAVALAMFAALAWASRERPFAFALALALAAVAAGFGAGCMRGALIAHPLLTRATGMVTLSGFVEARDGTERSDRIVLRLTAESTRGDTRTRDTDDVPTPDLPEGEEADDGAQ